MKEEEILDKLRELIDVMEEHWGVNQHGVPTEKIEQMRNRFIFKL
jgi:hypothetical protein